MTLAAARSWTLRKGLRFRHIGTRLTVLYTSLFAAVMLAVGIVGQAMILSDARQSVSAELVTSGSVFERLWSLKSRSLAESANVLARDFGFRAAVASGDVPTIASALVSLRQRAGVDHAFVVTQDGTVIGPGQPALRETVASLPFRLARGQHDAVVTSGNAVYRMVVSPVLAPTEIGWVVFAVALDGSEMRSLERLSAIPLTATVLRRTRDGTWLPATPGSGYRLDSLARFMAAGLTHEAKPGTIDLARGRAIAVARPFTAAGPDPEAVLLLSYPLAKALAPFRALQESIIALGVVGLLLVLWGSRRLAGSIARPIEALEEAARTLGEGERTEVPVTGEDEIGRLASSFNRMSAGIVEREHRIAHLAFHDTLTSLPNRAFFREQLETALTRALRSGEGIAVMCLDVDGLKSVNDTLGHPVGDALLRSIGELLSELAADGIAARLSGDEFAIILPQGFEADRPRALCQAIVDRLREPIAAGAHQILSGASIGIAVSPGDGGDAATLLKNADLALYRAKQDGRGVFRFFEPALDAAARHRRQMELDLREALHQGQLRLEFQPIYDLRMDRIGAFEALLRWYHPTRGLVSPVDFIPVAEETGLIVAMGEWVIHQACREAMRWPEHIRVAVNVSATQFRKEGLANIVLQALARSGLAPQRLEIEITESVFIDDTSTTLDLLHRLRALGVRIALDDFGTGYSSLSYLRSFPFDKIKIDRSFVTPVVEDERAAAIVCAIVDLANAFAMETTAEGVENEGQLLRLRAQGCSSIQGFLFSRPVEAERIPALLGFDGRLRATG